MGYWPQKQLVKLVKNGHLAGEVVRRRSVLLGEPPGQPVQHGRRHVREHLHRRGVRLDPGACPIDDSVTLDVALVNLAKIVAYIRSIKMPNGEDPRFLRPVAILVPPAHAAARGAAHEREVHRAGGRGGARLRRRRGADRIVRLHCSRSSPTSSPASRATRRSSSRARSSRLRSSAAFVYVDREPFKITYYTGGRRHRRRRDLDRADELEWHCKGRNVAATGTRTPSSRSRRADVRSRVNAPTLAVWRTSVMPAVDQDKPQANTWRWPPRV
jgi:hypothetical protein